MKKHNYQNIQPNKNNNNKTKQTFFIFSTSTPALLRDSESEAMLWHISSTFKVAKYDR